MKKKLKRYRHYLHKDSVRYTKKLERYWQAQTDSIHSALIGKEIKVKEKISKLREELYGKIPSGSEGKVTEQLGKVGDIPSIENVDVPNEGDLNVNDGDYKNEYFVVDKSLMNEAYLSIVNKWGDRVYFSPNYTNQWNGGDLPNGSYFYSLTHSCIKKPIKGIISILR